MVLHRVWGLIAARLERNGIRAAGRLAITRLDLAERACMGELLGRPVVTDRVSLDLEVMDRLLVQRDGSGLVAAVEEVCGEPLVARPPRRASGSARREAAFEAAFGAATEWLAAHPGSEGPWVGAWFDSLRRDGVLLLDADPLLDVRTLNSIDPTALLRLALEVLWDRCEPLAGSAGRASSRRSARSTRPVRLAELADRVAGDPHALDSDRRLSAVVLRALAARSGVELQEGPAARRSLWETAGVLTDLVSSTCLTWGLVGPDPTATSHDRPRPIHLTWWDLEAGDSLSARRDVLLCETPAVVEAVARADLEVGVICTSGLPDLVVTEVITLARDGGARLHYHGDFDWPGIALANRAVAEHGAVPCLMGTEDYLAAPGSLPLVGDRVEPAWAPDLGAAMAQRGVAVHEEAFLERLIDELSML